MERGGGTGRLGERLHNHCQDVTYFRMGLRHRQSYFKVILKENVISGLGKEESLFDVGVQTTMFLIRRGML